MPDGLGWQVIADTLAKYPRATLITGAPLKNLNQLLIQQPDIAIERCVIQGGFAGDAVVPPAKRMKKFDGMNECDTWNFGGCHEGAERMLNAPGIKLRQLCSKNVCHQVVYTAAMHERLEPIKNKNAAYSLLYEMMDKYLTNKGEKKLHDPLAVCTAIDPTIIEYGMNHSFDRS
jgi:pyrimidine-specific ribonucleoside hydrolase